MKKLACLLCLFLLLTPALALREGDFLHRVAYYWDMQTSGFYGFLSALLSFLDALGDTQEMAAAQMGAAYSTYDLENLALPPSYSYSSANYLSSRHPPTDGAPSSLISSYWDAARTAKEDKVRCMFKPSLSGQYLYCFPDWLKKVNETIKAADSTMLSLSMVLDGDLSMLIENGADVPGYTGTLKDCAGDLAELADLMKEDPYKSCMNTGYRSFTASVLPAYCTYAKAPQFSERYNAALGAKTDSFFFLVLSRHNKCRLDLIDEDIRTDKKIAQSSATLQKLKARFAPAEYYCNITQHHLLLLNPPAVSEQNSISAAPSSSPSGTPSENCAKIREQISSADLSLAELGKTPVFGRKYVLAGELESAVSQIEPNVASLEKASALQPLAEKRAASELSELEKIRGKMSELERADTDSFYNSILISLSKKDLYSILSAIEAAQDFRAAYSPAEEKQTSCEGRAKKIFACIGGSLTAPKEQLFFESADKKDGSGYSQEGKYCAALYGSGYYQLAGVERAAMLAYPSLEPMRKETIQLSSFLNSAGLKISDSGYAPYEHYFASGTLSYLDAACDLKKMHAAYSSAYASLNTTLSTQASLILKNLIDSSAEYSTSKTIYSDQPAVIKLAFKIKNPTAAPLPPAETEVSPLYPPADSFYYEQDTPGGRLLAYSSGKSIRLRFPATPPGADFEAAVFYESQLLENYGEECTKKAYGNDTIIECLLDYDYDLEGYSTGYTLLLSYSDQLAAIFEDPSNPGYISTTPYGKKLLRKTLYNTAPQEVLPPTSTLPAVESALELAEALEIKSEITGGNYTAALEYAATALLEYQNGNNASAISNAKKALATKVFDKEFLKLLDAEKTQMKAGVDLLNAASAALAPFGKAEQLAGPLASLQQVFGRFTSAVESEDISAVAESRAEFRLEHEKAYSLAESLARQALSNSTSSGSILSLKARVEAADLETIASTSVKPEVYAWAKSREYQQIRENLFQKRDFALGILNGIAANLTSADPVHALILASAQTDASPAESFLRDVQTLNDTAESAIEGTAILMRRGLLKGDADLLYSFASGSYAEGKYLEAVIYTDYIAAEKKSTPRSILYTLLSAPALFIPGAYLSRKKLKALFSKKPEDEIGRIERQLRKFK
ncbi:MAG: hypothetical protein ABH829_04955 [archaeon]